MAILSFKKQAGLPHILINVLKVEHDRVSLGLVAPKEVSIHRREIYDIIQLQEEALCLS